MQTIDKFINQPNNGHACSCGQAVRLIALICLLSVSLQAADEPTKAKSPPAGQQTPQNDGMLTAKQKQQILTWIKALGSRQYVERQQAQTNLMSTGWPALPYLIRVHQDRNPERRFRARQITHEIHHRRSFQEFQQLGQQAENAINLDKAMFAIARVVDPLVDMSAVNKKLDLLAQQVRKKLGANTLPQQIPPERAVAVIQQVLFQEYGLTGELANYDHPKNSSLDKVLQSRKGLPILLSHVVVSVAERADLPFVGVAIPGRYMVKYDGKQAPAGTPQKDILLDPFGGGKILTLEQLIQMIPSLERETALNASPKRDTVVRMLRNLEADYQEIGDLKKAEQTAGYRWLVER